ncbi:MAG TPA: PEP-CTERM sorting domain-containing protein [Verrucomicrobiae bacterium]
MKNSFLTVSSLLLTSLAVQAGTLSDTFEAGEDTSNWGASWSGGTTTNTFLNSSFGGLLAGTGSSAGQSFSRSFKNNTVGINLSQPYYISMYVQLNTFDAPSGGQFEIIDGAYGSGNAVDIKVALVGSQLVWQARDNNNGFQNIGLDFNLSTPYQVSFAVDPASFTYSVTINEVTGTGGVLDSASANGLSFDHNVINNGQNGTLLYYIQGSAGTINAMADNITISTTPTPEPSTIALLAVGAFGMLRLKSRVKAI